LCKEIEEKENKKAFSILFTANSPAFSNKMKDRIESTPKKEQKPTVGSNLWVINVSNREKPLELVAKALEMDAAQLSLVKSEVFCDLFIRRSEEILNRASNTSLKQKQYEWNRFLIASGILRKGEDLINEGADFVANPMAISHYQGQLIFAEDGFIEDADEAKRQIGNFRVIQELGQKLQNDVEDRLDTQSSPLPQTVTSLIFIFV